MSFAGPSKTCPRCNTVLPAQAPFCGTCGLQFPASAPPSAPAGGYGPTQYAGQGGPGGYPPPAQPGGYPPQGQPGYPPQGQPGYPPQGQPGYPPQGQPAYGAFGAPGQPPYPAGYAPGAPPKKGGAGRAIILVLVLVVLVGGGAAAWFLYLSPGHAGSPLFDRHGLQSNVPLPSNVTFVLTKSDTSTDPDTNTTVSGQAWGWTVSGSNPASVKQFYIDNLAKNGWKNVQTINDTDTEKDISACQGGQVLFVGANSKKFDVTDKDGKVTDTITAPSGGSALVTELSSSPALVEILCSGTPLLPTP
jgi:hypothetical protein